MATIRKESKSLHLQSVSIVLWCGVLLSGMLSCSKIEAIDLITPSSSSINFSSSIATSHSSSEITTSSSSGLIFYPEQDASINFGYSSGSITLGYYGTRNEGKKP
ncbi:MAG TPA: hypothetical protein VLM37_11195, partial [Fibrobacteraceae bacterium]|nr:hypothetical protein [Fibrobacteraceae bacterium]